MKKSVIKVVAVVLTLAVAFSAACPSALAAGGSISPEIIAQTSQTAIALESEGIVLLKNKDNALPLEGKKINVFGAGSVCPLLGGAGSGSISTLDPVFFYEALDDEGIEYNTRLRELYEKYCGSNNIPKTKNPVVNNALQLALTKSSLKELPMNKLTDKVIKEAVDFSGTAVIIISRTSAESSDLSEDVLRLSEDETALVERVTAAFSEVIVLFNTGNVILNSPKINLYIEKSRVFSRKNEKNEKSS